MPRPKRVVITGVNGFVGRHLVTELAAQGVAVVGVGHETGEFLGGVDEYVCQDLTRGWPAGLVFDAVVHLAGLSAVGPSFNQPQRYITDNSAMVTNLCEGLLAAGSAARVLVVSSGAVYDTRQDLPLSEGSRTGFSSPYVLSKLLIETQAGYYAERGLDIIVARPFNHIGPGQGRGFLLPDLVAEAAAAARSGEPMRVGNLETRRDYTDVRDVVRAYRLLLEAAHLENRAFNVCSGESWSGRELLGILESTWSYGTVEVDVDQRKARPADPREIVGDNTRLQQAVGWRPEIDVPTSIRDFIRSAS